MTPFFALLDTNIRRMGWTRAEFARRVGLSASTISAIFHGKRKPWFGRSAKWCDVLELKGREREEFLDAMAIASSVTRVSTIVARLERRARPL